MPAPKKFDQETQERAVRMYVDRLAEGGISQLKARQDVGELLGVNPRFKAKSVDLVGVLVGGFHYIGPDNRKRPS